MVARAVPQSFSCILSTITYNSITFLVSHHSDNTSIYLFHEIQSDTEFLSLSCLCAHRLRSSTTELLSPDSSHPTPSPPSEDDHHRSGPVTLSSSHSGFLSSQSTPRMRGSITVRARPRNDGQASQDSLRASHLYTQLLGGYPPLATGSKDLPTSAFESRVLMLDLSASSGALRSAK